MAEKQWIVGLFEEENKFSVLPSNWIIQLGNHTFCQWPKKRITDTMIINSEKPTKDWQPFPVKIIEKYSTYEQASKREKEIFLQSSESDQSLGRGKRKRKMKFKKSDTYSDGSDTDSSAAQTPIKIMTDLQTANENKLNKTVFETPLNLDAEPFVASASSSNNIISAAMQILCNPNNENILNFNTSESSGNQINYENSMMVDNLHEEQTNYISSISNELRENNLNDSMISKIWENVIAIHAYVKRHDVRLDKIEKLLQEDSTGYKHNKNKVFEDGFLALFPMKNTEAITSVDNKIKTDSKFESQMRAFIKTIGGTDTKNFIKCVLCRLFTNELSSQCSWTGFRSNFRLENLRFIEIMKEISCLNFKGTDILFENHVKDWFRHGSQRVSREKLKTNIIDQENQEAN